ncbi:MAG TPA: hypothetical protein ENF73_01575, partial [Proteobacteria bacterium]|nr:hypothetical protein [Pseudomonadota bacterium]
GHGHALADTHRAPSKLAARLNELRRREAIPFLAGVRAGAQSVMLAHIDLEDERTPASLSRRVIGYLKRGIGFRGAVVADDLRMEAVSSRFDIPDAALKAIEAGCDAVIISGGLDEQAQAMARAASALPARRVMESSRRLQLLWRRFAVEQPNQALEPIPL